MSTTTTPAVTNLAAVIVPVSDQDKMVDFYTEALGLEKRTDVPFGGGVEGRWVEVAPARGTDPDRALSARARQRGGRKGDRHQPADR